jgi:phosphoenolpyruvate carboxylase
LADSVFERIAAEWHRAHDALLAITGQASLLERDPRLASSIQSRLPYVDALNHLQVNLMARRRAGDADGNTNKGIHMAINGISAGLRNSG